MENDKIELKTIMETSEVADYLAALAAGFRAGRIVVEKNGEQLVLNPAAMSMAEVEVEARIKKDKAKFSLELSWRMMEQPEEGAEFKISTDLPRVISRPDDKKPEVETAKVEKSKTEMPKTEKYESKTSHETKISVEKKSENTHDLKKAEDKKPAPHGATAAEKPAHGAVKSDVKSGSPVVNEHGLRVVSPASAPTTASGTASGSTPGSTPGKPKV